MNYKESFNNEFPLSMELLGKDYTLDFVYENDSKLVFNIVNSSKVIEKVFTYKKDDGYINAVYFKVIVARNFESYKYWKECIDDQVYDEARLAVFYKYDKKWIII